MQQSNYPPPSVGDVLAGKYRIVRVIGQGGMGIVYAAHHEILDQEVALKLLLTDVTASQDVIARFVNEGRAAAKIKGEHVARVLDVGTLDDGRPFMAMELLEGEDLSEVLAREGPLLPPRVVDYLLQAMDALAQAHAMGIVHRDIKPSNLFLATASDGSRIVKLLDFGISKSAGGKDQQSLTKTRSTMGSPLYMSPEHVRSAKKADAQSDIWSLGVVGYELLSGKVPFDAESLGELFLAIVEADVTPLAVLRPELPRGLSEVFAKALEKDRARRYTSIVEFARALQPFATTEWAVKAGRIASVVSMAEARVGKSSDASQPSLSGDTSQPGLSGDASVDRRGGTARLKDAALQAAAAIEPHAARAASSQGTVANPPSAMLGAPMRSATSAGWSSTGSEPGSPPASSRRRLWIAAAAVLVAATTVGGGLAIVAGRKSAPAASAVSPVAPSATAAATAPPSADTVPVADPAASVSASPSNSPTTTAPAGGSPARPTPVNPAGRAASAPAGGALKATNPAAAAKPSAAPSGFSRDKENF